MTELRRFVVLVVHLHLRHVYQDIFRYFGLIPLLIVIKSNLNFLIEFVLVLNLRDAYARVLPRITNYLAKRLLTRVCGCRLFSVVSRPLVFETDHRLILHL